MIFRSLRHVVLVAIAAAACWGLSRSLAPWPAVALWAGVMAVVCVTAALLMRSVEPGRITWKNYLAGNLLPWGYTLSQGKLPGIVLTSWIVWTLIAVAVALQWQSSQLQSDPTISPSAIDPATTQPVPNGHPLRAPLLLIAWLLDGAAALYVLGILVKGYSPGSRASWSLIKMLALLLTMILGSIGLLLAGRPGLALLLAGGPLLAAGLPYALFLAAMLVFGRNARWN